LSLEGGGCGPAILFTGGGSGAGVKNQDPPNTRGNGKKFKNYGDSTKIRKKKQWPRKSLKRPTKEEKDKFCSEAAKKWGANSEKRGPRRE